MTGDVSTRTGSIVMTNVAVQPSSLEGIKRLAKTIKRDQGITHTLALDAAAQAGGFQNLRHAQHRLASGISRVLRTGKHDIYLTGYWRDDRGRSGRETLCIALTKKLSEIGTTREITRALGLRDFRVDAGDHLECIHDIKDQHAARDVVCKAARTLVFMEASGLVPATSRHRKLYRLTHSMPKRDHTALWVHPASETQVVSDEPYQGEELLKERAPWLTQHGLHSVAPTSSSMYSPAGATLFLVSDNEVFLDGVSARLGQVQIQAIAEEWNGDSAPYLPPFVSPARRESGVRKKSRPKPIVAGEVRNGALPYQMMPWGRTEWRPAGRIPIQAHAEIGGLLKTLIERHPAPERVMSSVEVIRSELDEWVQREFKRSELPDEQFTDLYYGHTEVDLPEGLTPRAGVARVKSLLAQHYGDCVPLRSVIRRLSTVERKI